MKKENLISELSNFDCEPQLKSSVISALERTIENTDAVTKTRTCKKLNNLYGGHVFIKKNTNSFVNLSDYNPTPEECEFLNLGINCHIPSKYDKLTKETEIEVPNQREFRICKTFCT